jgi:hypothetical protein
VTARPAVSVQILEIILPFNKIEIILYYFLKSHKQKPDVLTWINYTNWQREQKHQCKGKDKAGKHVQAKA